MGNDLRAIGDACWTSFKAAEWQRAIDDCQFTPVAEDTVYISTRGVVGNVTAVRTRDGLVVFDTGGVLVAQKIYDTLRKWDSTSPVHTVIFTHGHLDHCGATGESDAGLCRSRNRQCGELLPKC